MSNAPSSNICTFDETSIRVREEDLCENLIGKVGFTEFIFFLILGKWPTPAQTAVVDACLIAIAEHGFSPGAVRSEEHTSELQSLMRSSYAVFCLKKKNNDNNKHTHMPHAHTKT